MVLDSGPRPGLLLNTKNNPARNKKDCTNPSSIYVHALADL